MKPPASGFAKRPHGRASENSRNRRHEFPHRAKDFPGQTKDSPCNVAKASNRVGKLASHWALENLMRVLIVEDTPAVARLLKQSVAEAGFSPEVEGDGLSALARVQSDSFDLVLLDWMLPGLSGLEVCRRMRQDGQKTPVLMLTARDTTEDKVAGLDAGADDYIVKPFAVVELLARMRALLRRGSQSPTTMQVGELSLDSTTRRANRSGKQIYLSATEYTLLEYLMRNAGKTLTRAQLLDHVWQYDFGGNDNVLDCYISYLRQKIDKGQEKRLIHTVRGVGFRLGE